jgi:hypothetical protein
MTGDTENGKSISVIRIYLPRKNELRDGPRRPTPKIVFSGATKRVVRIDG